MCLVRARAESPISSSSSVSSSEPSIAKSPLFKPPFPAHLNNGSSSSDQHSLPPSAFPPHSIYGSSTYSPFNCLSSNNNSNGMTGSLREHSNEQQHHQQQQQQQQQQQNLLHDRLFLHMAAASRQQHLSFDGHPPPPNGLWRPTLRPFIGKYKVFFFLLLVKYIVIRSYQYSSPA